MKLLTSTVVVAIVFASQAAAAFDRDGTSFGERYVARNCAWCHGTSVQGFSTAPRLAGQQAPYIEAQILDFRSHSRDNPSSKLYMWGAAAPLSRPLAHEVATYLASLNAEAARDGRESLVTEGEGLYRQGSQETNIAACVVCHGPNAEGAGAIPRIGGLGYRYLKRRLEQWGEGYHASAAAPMPGIASKLSESQVEALASYLSFVP